VLALDSAAAGELEPAAADLQLVSPARVRFDPAALPFRDAAFDGLVAARLIVSALPALARALRPGGRFIALVPIQAPADWLARLAQAGFVHLYAESGAGSALVRGERPPEAARPVDRLAALAGAGSAAGSLRVVKPRAGDLAGLGRHVHLLIAQSPNRPPWQVEPGERLEWRTPIWSASGQAAVAPAFSSLVKAVQFMQAAVLAGAAPGINKIGKFPAAAAQDWPFHLAINPAFEAWQDLGAAGLAWLPVDWRAAMRGEE
jgi:hypothetical protein